MRHLTSPAKLSQFMICVGVSALGMALSAQGEEAPGSKDVVTAAKGFWEWDESDRRDPFEYRSPEPVDVEGVAIEPISRTLLPTVPTTVVPRDTATAQQISQFVTGKVAEARYYLGLQQHGRAAEAIEEAAGKLKAMKVAEPGLAESVERVQLTAQRLKARAEIESEFRGVSIEIQGIIWEPTNPMALIEGKTVREGDVVEGALIEEIRTSEIIFNYKGVRCRRQPGR